MAKTQFPIDGRLGKEYKVTSPFGWRTHPTSGKKSHHNGVDLWGGANLYNEAFHDGTVIFSGPSKLKKSDGSVGGFGYHVMIHHKIDGKDYVSVYAHNEKDSIKVKKGQKVVAGTVLGKMGASGDVTGKHLHFEIYVGKTYAWSATGKNFVDPIAFIKALMAKEAVLATAPLETPEDAPVAPVAVHGPATKPAVAPVTPAKPELKGQLKKGSKNGLVTYLQNSLKVVGDEPGVFGDNTHKAVVLLQKRTKLLADGIVGPLTWGKIK